MQALIAGSTEGGRNLEAVLPRDGAPSSNQSAPPPGKASPRAGSLSRLTLLVIFITALPIGCLLALNVSRDAAEAFNWPWMSWSAWSANAPEAAEARPAGAHPLRATLSRPSFADSLVQTVALEPSSAPSTPREAEVAAQEGGRDEAAAAGDKDALPLADLASPNPTYPSCKCSRSYTPVWPPSAHHARRIHPPTLPSPNSRPPHREA